MRITDIKSYPVWIGTRNLLLVKVETDSGVAGWGESGLSGREQAVIGALAHFRTFLVGADPMQRGRIWQELYRSQYFEGGRVLLAAQSAIDIALHDIAGKALGVPVHQLLGGRQRDTVACFATTGAAGERLVEELQQLQAQGWRVVRTVPAIADERGGVAGGFVGAGEIFEPRESIAATAHWLIRAREACGPDLTLGIDYHHRLSIAEAASFCQRLPRGTLDFIEEPIRDETPAAYAALRARTEVPFAVGEEFSSKWAFVPFIEQHLTDFARLDICNVGGFTEAMKIAGWAEAHYIDLMPHNPLGPIATAASIHLAAAVPNFAWLEARVSSTESLYYGAAGAREAAALFPVQPTLAGTGVAVSDAPGLGIEVDESRAAQAAFRFWEAPHWRRRDGSVTNW